MSGPLAVVVAMSAAFVALPGPAIAGPESSVPAPKDIAGPQPAGPTPKDAARPKPSGPAPKDAARLARVWAASPANGTIASNVTYVQGSVYYTEDAWPLADPRYGERITRRDAATGRPLPFAAPAGKALSLADPATDGVRIFTISAYENAEPVAHVRAYTLAGRAGWARRLPGERFLLEIIVAGPIVIAAGELGCDREPEAGCERTTVAAWWASSGEPAWQRTVPGGSPQLAVAAGQLTVSTATAPGIATLTAVDASTGGEAWVREGLPAGPVAADAGAVYLAAGNLCALRAKDGSRRWCVKDRRYHAVTVAGGGLYTVSDAKAAGRDERVVALTTGGRTRWAAPASPTGPLTVSNGVVYFQHYPLDGPTGPHPVDRPTRLVALRGNSGAKLAEVPVSDGYSSGSVAVGGGRVFTSAYLTAVLGYAPKR